MFDDNDTTKTKDGEVKSFLDEITKRKGEQWKDPEVLAKGKLEADAFIDSLQEQIKELREDLSKQDYSKSLLEALETKRKAAETITAPNDGANKDSTKSLTSEEELKSLVERTISQREMESTAKQNKAVVEEFLNSQYGTDAEVKIKTKADELGLTPSRLGALAAESPNAFFALMGEAPKKGSSFVKGNTNTEGGSFSKSSERDSAFYSDLRKKNRKLYYSPEVQQRKLEDRKRLGDKF